MDTSAALVIQDRVRCIVPELSGDLAAAYAKLEASAAWFALVFELVKNPASVAVGGESMTSGITLARWFAEEARRVYSMLSESAEEQADRELTDLIGRKGGIVTVRDVQRARREYQTSEEAEAAIQRLVDRDIGQWFQEVVPTPPAADGLRVVFTSSHK